MNLHFRGSRRVMAHVDPDNHPGDMTTIGVTHCGQAAPAGHGASGIPIVRAAAMAVFTPV